MEKQEKKSKKEIWKEISLDFRSLCRELRLWWLPGRGNSESEKKIRKKKVGMFYYAKKNFFSEKRLWGKTMSGIVAYVDETGEHGLIVLLHPKKMQWSSDKLSVRLPRDSRGKERTRLILEAAAMQAKKAEAAEYCATYAFDGIKAGEAFLPSMEEWEKAIGPNISLLNEKWRSIKGKDLLEKGAYWSSSQFLFNLSFALIFGDDDWDLALKDNNDVYVCPVIAF